MKKKKKSMIDRLIEKMQPKIQEKVDLFEKNLIIDVCNRLHVLLDNKIDDKLLNSVLVDLQNGGYKVGTEL